MQETLKEVTVYQGQFGSFSVTRDDRLGVILYRLGLSISAICLILGTVLVLWLDQASSYFLTPLFYGLIFGLGLSLFNIHIYLILLHRLLKVFWLIGTISALLLTFGQSEPLVLYVYEHPLFLLGIGFIFVALTGIYFKEAFCFNRLETKILTPLVPFLLLGHLTGLLSGAAEKVLLVFWSILFLIFVIRKARQPLDPDLGDLSVFAYLESQK
jgi:uncharacterized integral membrane protein